MKNFKRVASLLLALAMILTFAACQSGDASGDKGKDAPNRPAANTETLAAPEYNVADKVVEVVVDADFTGQDPEKNTWARIAQSAKNHYGVELKPIVIPLEQQTTRIISMIASDTPPDIVETSKLPGWFPRMCSEGTFVAISDYVNFEDLLWKDEVDTMSNYMIGDDYYALSLGAYTPNEMIYNKKIIREAGLTDPVELYKKGEWTWGKFEEYIEKLSGDTDGDYAVDVFGTDNYPMSHCYLTSLGTGVTQLANGKISLDPITGKNYEKLADYLNKMCRKQSNGYMPDVDGRNGTTVDLLSAGRLVFSFAGRWTIIENEELNTMKNNGELALVMLPKNEEADNYYCYGVTSGYAIPSKGNVIGAIATLTSTRLDDFPSKERLEKEKKAYIADGWDEDSAHILAFDIAAHSGSYQQVKLVSLGIDVFNSTLQTTVNDLLYDPLYQGIPAATAKSSYLSKLQTAVDSANKLFETEK